LAGEGAVDLVNKLPALEVQRLGDGGDLVLAVADALEGGSRAVAGRDLPRVAFGRVDAGRDQRRRREVEIEVVDRDRIGPLVAVSGEKRGGELAHPVAEVADRGVLGREHLAAGAVLDRLCGRV